MRSLSQASVLIVGLAGPGLVCPEDDSDLTFTGQSRVAGCEQLLSEYRRTVICRHVSWAKP
jgi:hypothetical protein